MCGNRIFCCGRCPARCILERGSNPDRVRCVLIEEKMKTKVKKNSMISLAGFKTPYPIPEQVTYNDVDADPVSDGEREKVNAQLAGIAKNHNQDTSPEFSFRATHNPRVEFDSMVNQLKQRETAIREYDRAIKALHDDLSCLRNQDAELTSTKLRLQTLTAQNTVLREDLDERGETLDIVQAALSRELSREKSYLDSTWDRPLSSRSGFDFYFFGYWVSLRRTIIGWKFRSGFVPDPQL